MKAIERLKKGLMGIGFFLLTIPTKVFATMEMRETVHEALYGSPYEIEVVERPSTLTIILRIARTFIIPIVLLIGLIIYFKKSKSSTKKKILVTIGIISLTAIAYFVINKIIYELT